MGQYLGPDQNGGLVRNSTTQVQLNLSLGGLITSSLGGQQYYSNSALLLNTGGTGIGGLDTGALSTLQVWYVHLVLNSTVPALVASLSKTAPTGFSTFVWTGWVFVTNGSSQVDSVKNTYVSTANIVSFNYVGTPNGTPAASLTDVVWPVGAKVVDSHSGYNPSTGIYTVQVAGNYILSAQLFVSGSYGLNYASEFAVVVNGSIRLHGGPGRSPGSPVEESFTLNGIGLVLAVGDQVKIQYAAGATSPSWDTGTGYNWFSLFCVGTL